MLGEFVTKHNPSELTAHTRNPSILRLLGTVSGVSDVLRHDNPERLLELLPHAAPADNTFYHMDRYAPTGLYDGIDPASRNYNGLPLSEQYISLQNRNNALAVMVSLKGDTENE